MNFSNYLETWRGALAENRFHRFVRLVELGVICALVALLYMKDTIVTVTPPNFDSQLTISKNGANEDFKKAWGYFSASQMGNITPENVDFVLQSIEELMAPGIYQDVVESLSEQAETVKSEKLTTQFEIQSVEYMRSEDLVFVTGRHTTRGSFGEPDVKNRTYEFKIEVVNYKPTVTHLSVYAGKPRRDREEKKS